MTLSADVAAIPTLADIEAAHGRIRAHVRETPTIVPGAVSLGLPERPEFDQLVLKLELLQHTGSFKPRGAFNRALAGVVPPSGLAAASGGNHGIAVAHVAQTLGVPAEIFVPSVSPAVKRQRIADLGAVVHVSGALYDDAQSACDERAATTGAFQIHPFDHFDTVAGQATMTSELLERHPEVDTIVVAAGGGGLAAGVAARCRDDIKVVVVEPATSRCVGAALDAGRPTTVDVAGVAADSLGARRVGDAVWPALSAHVDEWVDVEDDDIVEAQRRLWSALRLVVEPGGAAALAAIISGRWSPPAGAQVAVVVCGSNTDPSNVMAPDRP